MMLADPAHSMQLIQEGKVHQIKVTLLPVHQTKVTLHLLPFAVSKSKTLSLEREFQKSVFSLTLFFDFLIVRKLLTDMLLINSPQKISGEPSKIIKVIKVTYMSAGKYRKFLFKPSRIFMSSEANWKSKACYRGRDIILNIYL